MKEKKRKEKHSNWIYGCKICYIQKIRSNKVRKFKQTGFEGYLKIV